MKNPFRVSLLAILAAMALAISLTPASGAVLSDTLDRTVLADDEVDNGEGLPATRQSSNLELVANIDLPGGGGTDIEFFSRDMDAYRVDGDGDGFSFDDSDLVSDSPMRRHFALVGNQNGAWTADITDPENPYLVHVFPTSGDRQCNVGQGDTQTSFSEDGETLENGTRVKDGMIFLLASQSGGSCKLADGTTARGGSIVVDNSDIYNPQPISIASESGQGAHNNTLHPSGDYIYISTSALAPTNGTNSRIPIYDISDPANPVKVRDFMIPANGPHDVRFNQDGTRAYTAGISAFHILNTEDPGNPSIIATMTPPGNSIGHDSLISADGRFLFLGDEAGGGLPYPCPGGAVHVYDLMNEATPIYLGQVYAGGGPVTGRTAVSTETGGVVSCTSHVMELDPSGQSLTLGWYGLGFRIFDFSSFYNADGTPKSVAGVAAAWGSNGAGMVETHYMIPDGGSTWSAKQYAEVPGYVFADDISVGLYVAKILD